MGPGRVPVIVAFEGIDGSGVSTHSRLLAERLKSEGYRVYLFKEPSGGPVGGLVRSILGGGIGVGDSGVLLGLLFAADRVWQFYYGDPAPADILAGEPGAVLVFDRYKYSSIVYQASALLDPAPREWLFSLNEAVPPAHIVVFLDVEPGVAWKRIRGRRGGGRELFEDLEVLGRVYEGYRALFGELGVKPEYPGGGGSPLWAWLLARRGVVVEEVWPLDSGRGGVAGYPVVVRVRGSTGGVDRPVEVVAGEVYESVRELLGRFMGRV